MIRDLIGTPLIIDQKTPQAFNLDTILLARFTRLPAKAKHVIEIGAGNGALMLYLSTKTKALITGIEIQEHLVSEALENIRLNGLEAQLKIVLADAKEITLDRADCVVSNPPFFKVNHDMRLSDDMARRIARHEVMITLEEVISKASSFLGQGGCFHMIHRPERLIEILGIMKTHGFEIKRLRFVHPYLDHKANHVLIRADKGGQPGIITEPPLILYRDKGILSDEMKIIYGGINDAFDNAFTQGKT
ncbi:MAG: methyltransferase [Acholeplasmataceae bacterium]|nr:methyltransferase [Acholeplasmataceae bacterium]